MSVSRSQAEKRGPGPGADRYDVAVLGKALDVLETLVAAGEMGLSQLAAESGVSKTSAFRVLTTLEVRGYLAKDPASRRYRPGPKLIALGGSLVSGLDVLQAARPVLESLHRRFGETVNLGVLAEGRVLYLDMIESQQGLRTISHVGSRDPLHCTALGKALLACLPPSEARQLLTDYRRVRQTPHTRISLHALERELARVRDQGYALDDEENELGARCVGAAIVDSQAQPVAALSLSGPTSRLTDKMIARVGEEVRLAARAVEHHMGYAPRHAQTPRAS
ncbi:MAG: IclR family transcriptional regulator [Chloroflexi bacterium]|nr:IclR family transcriptional regulator [Chloroflexota bacterium]